MSQFMQISALVDTPHHKAHFRLISVKDAVYVDVRVQQLGPDAGQVQPVQDEVLKGLLQASLTDEHRPHELVAQQQHAHKGGLRALRDRRRCSA